MIKIEIRYSNNQFAYLKVSGHANSAEYGKDIVCAGVSAIVIGGLNNIEAKNYDIKVTDGLVEVTTKNEITTHDMIVFETIFRQLETMEESYSKYIKIIK